MGPLSPGTLTLPFRPLSGWRVRAPPGEPLGRKAVDRVDVRDIADAAVRAFTPGWSPTERGQSSDRALTGAECAEAWSRALGRPVRYEDDLPRWSELVRAPLGEAVLGDWTKTFKLIQRHGFVTSPRELALTRKLLGREPRSYEAWALEQAGQLAAKPRAA